jgi:hypothetical protein
LQRTSTGRKIPQNDRESGECRLKAAEPKRAEEITELERWRDLARQTAIEYVDSRRRPRAGKLIFPQPTD